MGANLGDRFELPGQFEGITINDTRMVEEKVDRSPDEIGRHKRSGFMMERVTPSVPLGIRRKPAHARSF